MAAHTQLDTMIKAKRCAYYSARWEATVAARRGRTLSIGVPAVTEIDIRDWLAQRVACPSAVTQVGENMAPLIAAMVFDYRVADVIALINDPAFETERKGLWRDLAKARTGRASQRIADHVERFQSLVEMKPSPRSSRYLHKEGDKTSARPKSVDMALTQNAQAKTRLIKSC